MGGCNRGLGGVSVAVGGEVSHGADAVACVQNGCQYKLDSDRSERFRRLTSCIHQGASTKCVVESNVVVPVNTFGRTEECVDAFDRP